MSTLKPSSIKKLRSGFSTGACSAAIIRAAWTFYHSKEMCLECETLFPDGLYRTLKIEKIFQTENCYVAQIVKDGGDDPDITNGARIIATLRPCELSELDDADYCFEIYNGTLILRGGEGVGKATRLGLELDVGKWAINPVPRKMIVDNLKDAGFGKTESQCWLAELSVENGEALAKKTLNPTLGVIGGISILGTTGIVEPHSHKAYIETVRIMVSSARKERLPAVVFCTGARSARFAREHIPYSLPEYAYIRIGDFIAESLDLAAEYRIPEVVVACMPGKLFKYACGYRYTHAHSVALDTEQLGTFLHAAKVEQKIIDKAVQCPTVKEALAMLTEKEYKTVLSYLKRSALGYFHEWYGSRNISILLFSSSGELIGLNY